MNDYNAGESYLYASLVCMMDVNTGCQRKQENRVLTSAIMDWLYDEAAFCLDAPDKLPAGSCYNDYHYTPKGWYGTTYQTTIKR